MYRHMKSSSKSDTLSFRNFRIMCRTRKRLVNISLLILTHRRLSTTIKLVMLVPEFETWFFINFKFETWLKNIRVCVTNTCARIWTLPGAGDCYWQEPHIASMSNKKICYWPRIWSILFSWSICTQQKQVLESQGMQSIDVTNTGSTISSHAIFS
jgi:hypothetical protein